MQIIYDILKRDNYGVQVCSVTKLLAHLSCYGKKKENRQLNNRKADRQTDRQTEQQTERQIEWVSLKNCVVASVKSTTR